MAKDKFDPERDIVHDFSYDEIATYVDGRTHYLKIAGSFNATFYTRDGTELLQCVVVELPRKGDEVRIDGVTYPVAAVLREYSDVSPVHKATIHVD